MALDAGNNDKLSILKHALAGDSAALARVVPDDDAESPAVVDLTASGEVGADTLVATTSVTSPTFVVPSAATVTDLATLIAALEAIGLIVDGT